MELKDYLRLVRAQWLTIVVCVVVATAGAVVVTMRATPMYSASVKLIVSARAGTADASTAYQGNLLSQQLVKSYADLLTGRTMAQAVVADLKLSEPAGQVVSSLHASAVPDTNLLVASVTDPSPRQAQRLANSLATQFTRRAAALQLPSAKNPPAVTVSVAEPATLPTSPVSPKPVRNVALAVVLGLLLGLGVAVLRRTLDTSVKTVEDVGDLLDTATLGVIGFESDARKRPLLTDGGPHSSRAEAFRQLRTNLQFVDVDNPPRSIVVTSALPLEGKSTTACNLAITLAQAGRRVALIEGDLRRPKVTDYMGLEGAVGVTSVLIGTVPLEDALQPWGTLPLQVLASGPTPPNPSELLGSQGMRQLIETLESRFDFVIVDAPPLLPVTDAAVISTLTGGAVVVVRAARTRREHLARAVEALGAVDGRLLGVVLNMVPRRGSGTGYGYAYGYGYGYGYGAKHAPAATPAQVVLPVDAPHNGAAAVAAPDPSASLRERRH